VGRVGKSRAWIRKLLPGGIWDLRPRKRWRLAAGRVRDIVIGWCFQLRLESQPMGISPALDDHGAEDQRRAGFLSMGKLTALWCV